MSRLSSSVSLHCHMSLVPVGIIFTLCSCCIYRVTTCLENLEMSGNYTGVREMSGISLEVMEMSENCQGKNLVMENCVTVIIFHYSVAVDVTGFYDVIIMKSLSLNVNLTVWSLPLTLVVQAWYEYQLKWSGVPWIVGNCQGISQCLESGHPVYNASTCICTCMSIFSFVLCNSAAACRLVNTVWSRESSKAREEKTQTENRHWRETGKHIWLQSI